MRHPIIAVAGARFHIPIGVGIFFFWIKVTKYIRVAVIDDSVYPRAFFWKKSCVLLVFFRTREINGLVRGVDVTAEYDTFCLARPSLDGLGCEAVLYVLKRIIKI